MLQEFKDFALKGNVLDLAVAVVMGAAFNKIVTALVSYIIMPLIGLIFGTVDFAKVGPSWVSNTVCRTIDYRLYYYCICIIYIC